MLADSRLVAFVATADPENARRFYEDALGLKYIGEDRLAMLFDAGGTVLRVVGVDEVNAPPYTVLGWTVDDIDAVVADLKTRGVEFHDYDFLDDENPTVWSAPDGTKVAWFTDPDGNVLSIYHNPT